MIEEHDINNHMTDEMIFILNDPSASDWLKSALRSAIERDLVDSVNDTEILLEVLMQPIFNAVSPSLSQQLIRDEA